VLGPAQPDPFGSAVARVARLVRGVGVRADPQAPARVSEKPTAGRPFSSSVGRAIRRSWPVIGASFFTR